jgi:hypothetical protein
VESMVERRGSGGPVVGGFIGPVCYCSAWVSGHLTLAEFVLDGGVVGAGED